VAFGFDEGPDFFDLAVRPNEEGAAHDSRVGPAHKLFFLPRAKLSDRLMPRIAEQRKVEFVFFLERCERLDGIRAHPEDSHTELVELQLCVTKLGRFNRSTGSIGFREKEEQDAVP
jgi:hypothetical protein